MSAEEYAIRARLRDEGDSLTNRLLAELIAMTYNIHRARNTQARTGQDWLPQYQAHAAARAAPATMADVQTFMSELEKPP